MFKSEIYEDLDFYLTLISRFRIFYFANIWLILFQLIPGDTVSVLPDEDLRFLGQTDKLHTKTNQIPGLDQVFLTGEPDPNRALRRKIRHIRRHFMRRARTKRYREGDK